jgi:hypothetical protein
MKVMDSLRLQLIVAANTLPCAIEGFYCVFLWVLNIIQNVIGLTSFSNRFNLENAAQAKEFKMAADFQGFIRRGLSAFNKTL